MQYVRPMANRFELRPPAGAHPKDGERVCALCFRSALQVFNGRQILAPSPRDVDLVGEADLFTCSIPVCGGTYPVWGDWRHDLDGRDLLTVLERREDADRDTIPAPPPPPEET